MKAERPEKSELQWDEETLIYVDALESQNKELIETGSKITKHIISNANTLTNRALLKLCGEFNNKTNKK